MPLLPIWVRAGFDTPEEYAESLATPAPTPAPPPAPVAVPVAAPRSVNKIDAQIARNYLRSMGFDPTGLNAQQLADKLHQITPSEYYEITGWTPDTPAAAPQVTAAPPAAAPAPTPAPVAPVAAEEPPIVIDEVGDLDPESKIAKRRQGFEPVYNPMNYPYPGDKGGFNIGQVFGVVLAVASLSVPGIGSTIGSAILSAVGITGASAAVTTGVGAAALSAASTAVQGGSVEDVLKSAASAGVSAGLNIGLGGGVAGAVSGSAAGTLIKGGDASQVLTNAFAAGVGAGVQGALPDNPDSGKILGTAARTYIATGGNVDQTLLNTAVTAIGTLDQPDKSAQQLQAASTPASDAVAQESAAQEIEEVTQSDAQRRQELADYQEKLNQYAIDKAIYEQTYGPIADEPPAVGPTAQPSAETTLAPQTIVGTTPDVFPVVTDLDLVKKVAEQPAPTVDPKELEKVIVQGQKETANAAPVVTDITESRPDTTRGLPAPTAELPSVTVTGKKEEEIVPTVTDIPEIRPDTTIGLPTPTAQLDPVTITGKREEDTSPTVTELPPVTITGEKDPTVEFPPVTVTGQRDPVYELDPVTVTGTRDPTVELDPVTIIGKREDEVAPPVTELDPVTVIGKKDPIYELDPVTITGKPDIEFDPVTITGKKEDDVIIEDPLPPKEKEKDPTEKETKEKPKGETKKVYPTITSVPPPKTPRAPPIITGASPARLLADALAAYRPSGAVEGVDSGKERQNVWNEKSLRLKDALGL